MSDFESVILEANALMESVYRNLASTSPIGNRTRRRVSRAAARSAASQDAERQIANINNVLNEVEENLSVRAVRMVAQPNLPENGGDNVEEIVPSQQQQDAEEASNERPSTPLRSGQQLPVIIDLCTDSPRSDDVIFVPEISPRVIDLDSPIPEQRRRRKNADAKQPATSNAEQNQDANTALPVNDRFKCAICMDEYADRQPVTTKCGHIFCEICIREAIRLTHKCPICKRKLDTKHLIRVFM